MGLFSKLKGDSKAKEAEKERADASSSDEAAPPPYMSGREEDPNARDSEDAPDYERPVYPSGGHAMVKFPPSFNLYGTWKSFSSMYVGTSREDKVYLVRVNWGWFTSRPPITIHNGLSKDDPILVQAGTLKPSISQSCTMRVPERPGREGPTLETRAGYVFKSWKDWSYNFTVRVPGRAGADGKPGAPQEETFEWRTSRGDEVRAPNGGSWFSSGWKLVWVTGPEVGEGGKRKEREAGFTSDGREIVAVAAHNVSGNTLTKPLRFAFMGTGLTGILGEDWEALAAGSALQLWWLYQMNTTAATTAAAST